MGRVAARLLDAVRDASVGEHRQSLERERRTPAVTHEPFAADVVVAADRDGGVKIEPVQRDGMTTRAGRLVTIGVGAAPRDLPVDLVEEACLDGGVGARVQCVERVRLGVVGRAVVIGTTIEAATCEPTQHGSTHAREHGEQLGARGRAGLVEDGRSFALAREEALELHTWSRDLGFQRRVYCIL
jgi:hypothetical protein